MRGKLGVLIVVSFLGMAVAWADSVPTSGPGEGQQSKPLRVLVLYSNQRTLPANQDVQQGLWTSLGVAINSHRIELFEEYLEIHRLPVGDEEPPMVAYLLKRYQEMEPDVVVSVGPQALGFSGEWLAKVFPEAVQVFAGVREDQLVASTFESPPPGVLNVVAARPLLEVVARILPNTDAIVLVGGTAPFDRELLREVRNQIEGEFSWEVSEISGPAPGVIADEVSKLSQGTVILFTTFFRDSSGITYIPKNVLAQICERSAVPVFALYDTMLGAGVTGIGASPFFGQGLDLGEIIKRIAAGESPEGIGVVDGPAPRLLFDFRAMQRYGIDPARLPSEVEVFFETPGLIESHPVAFLVGTVTILVQSFLILALLLTRHRKRRAEKKAFEMERYFSTVFRENPNPMAVIRISDGVFQDINPAWETVYEVKREAALGRSPVEIGMLFEEKDLGLYEDFLNTKKVLSGYERQVRTGSGEIRNVAFFSNSVEIAGTELYILTTVDTSDRIEAERLRSSLARDNRVAQLGHISAWMAHEINQPLGSILSNTEAVLLHLDSEDDRKNEIREILADIKADDRRASRVVERIRAMLGNQSVTKESVGITEIFEEVYRMASPEAGRRAIDLRYSAGGIPPFIVFGDRILLAQVLLNLIFNAMDAVAGVPMSERMITLGCETTPEEGWFELTVRDRGPGVDASEFSAIFEFFYSTKEEGMGLGLAISRFIIEDHQGELTVANSEEGGACFRVKLPLQKTSA